MRTVAPNSNVNRCQLKGDSLYILFPLFLMLMWRFRKRWILSSFIVIAVISLVLSQWAAYNKPSANFFLLPTRGWELAIGACIAFYFLYRKQTVRAFLFHRFVDEALGLVGLLMVGYAVFSFDETVPFPSFYTLIPTIGAGLIILFSSAQTVVGRLLGTRFLVGIGLISYSIYLWHQPLLAFTRHASFSEPSKLTLAAVITLSFPLAYLSYRFVEKPFRKKEGISRNTIFCYSAIGSIAFGLIGIAGVMTDGFGDRSTKNKFTLNSIEQKLKVNHGLSEACDGKFTLSPDCRTSDEPEILIWGDSFAMHLVQGFIVSNPNPKIIQMTRSFCGPFFDIAPVSPTYSVSQANSCLEFTEEVRKWIKTNNTVKYVVVSSFFGQYLAKENKLLSRKGNIEAANINAVTEEFNKTLEELESIGVFPVIFSPPPANGVNLGRCLARAEWMGLSLDKCNFSLSRMSQTRKNVYSFLKKIKLNYRVIRLDNLICDNSLCKAHFGSTWIFRDTGHLSREGSAALGNKFGFYRAVTNLALEVKSLDSKL